ncbi:unnamed protein product, partial [Ectocarpus sp. 8 AP-2014]
VVQLVKAFPAEAVAAGGDLVLMQLSMSLWRRYPSDPLVVEAVEDLLLALTRVPQAVPRMTETLVPLFREVFERLRAGEEELQTVAEGCLSLLRELTMRLAAAGGGVGGVHSRGGAGLTGGGGGVAAAATRRDSSARLSLWAGLRAAFPLLLETDSHSLVQDGCGTLQEFVTAFGDEMDEDADGATAAAAAAGREASGGGETGGGGGGGDSPLSLVLSFLGRVMDPEAHDASALRIGGLVSAVLKSVPPRSLGRETVQSLLAVTFDKLERCSSSLLGDELLQVFVTFVNSEAYGPTALADVFAEMEREGRRRCQQEEDATAATAVAGPTERPLSNATITPPRPSSSRGSGGISNGGAGGERLDAASSPVVAVGAVARGGGGSGGVGNDDTMASLRRLIGLWLFFHEMARSSSLASQSALGLVRLLKAAGEGDARLYTLRVSTDSMGSGSSRGAGVRGRSLPPSLRKMEGELLPVCLLSSIVRTAERDDEADGPPEGVANNNNNNRSCEDGGAMFPLDVDDDDDNADEDAYMADEFDPAGPPEGDTDDDSDDDDDDSDDDDEDDEESDTEDITDEGSMTLSSCSGGGDGGGGGGVPSPYYASDVSQRFAAAVDRRTATAAPRLSSSAPAATAPMGMSVDSSRWAGATSTTVTTTTAAASSATAFSATGLPCFSGGSVNLTRCSSSNSLPAAAAAAAAATAPAWRGRSASGDGITCRVSSAPLASGGGDGGGGGRPAPSYSRPR